MDSKGILAELPGWVKWVAIPILALIVFSWLIGPLIKLLVSALLFVALVGGLIYVVRKFTSASSSSRHGDW
jgi:hypothetical protein